MVPYKFRRIRVPTPDLFSSRVLKVCNPSRVKARYWKPKIVYCRNTNTSPVQTGSNIIVHTQILTSVMTFFSWNASLFVFVSTIYIKIQNINGFILIFQQAGMKIKSLKLICLVGMLPCNLDTEWIAVSNTLLRLANPCW